MLQELLMELSTSPEFFLFVVIIFTLMIGSFLNVVIYRIPKKLFSDWKQECLEFLAQNKDIEETPKDYNIAWPSSQCPSCKTKLYAIDNIPILSYFLLRGKCRFCHASIPIRYPIVEILTTGMSAIAAMNFGYSIECIFALLITWVLIAQTFIDLDHMIIPDNITIPMLWLGLLASVYGIPHSSKQAILGAIFGYVSLWSVYTIFKLLTKKEGMGHGDFKLLAMLGAWLGWQMIPQIIVISSLLGSIVGISIILAGKKTKDTPFPFVPYLAIAGWISLNWGQQINQYYLHNLL
jgi:leader peptidase (prepilin peptidase) / N-methyltransferase